MSKKRIYVFINVSKTGQNGKKAQFCEMAALSRYSSHSEFANFVMPDCEISEKATAKHGYKKVNN